MAELVKYELRGRVAMIGLNRPDKLNALNADLLAEFDAILDRYEADDSARVAVLYGEGRSFSVGHDLSPNEPRRELTAAEDRRRIAAFARRWLRLWDCPKPVVAQIGGRIHPKLHLELRLSQRRGQAASRH